RPGKIVRANDVLCVLSNPELTQEAVAADLDAKGAEAKLASLRVTLESTVLDRRAEHAKMDSDLQQAKLQLKVNEELSKNGLVSDLELKLSRLKASDLQSRFEI